MRKWIRLGLCLGALTVALTCSALAAGEATDGYTTANENCTVTYDAYGKNYTASYTGAKAGEQYALLVVRGTVDEKGALPPISDDTIMYIDQTAADDNGTVSFENFIPKSTPNCVVLLGGVFENGVTSPVTLGTLKAQGVTVSGSVSSMNRIPATVKLYDASKELLQTVQTDESGNYSFSSVPMTADYYIEVVKPGHIGSPTLVSVDDTDVTVPIIQLYGGDIDGSNAVDAPDLTAVIIDYNKTSGFTNENSDLDKDGAVNAVDLTAVITNYNRIGEKIE